jgi:acetyl esterase
MTVHPQARALLDLIAAEGAPEPSDEHLGEIRSGFASLVAIGAGPAEAVADVRDLVVPTRAGGVPIRIYRPQTASGTGAHLPMVVFIHGGGWTIGSVDDYDPIARRIANASGAVVLSVDYRLAPEHPHPAALDDAWAATTWAVEHAAELGCDGRFALMGDSAGGNLAAVIAQRAAREGGPHPALQVLVYPVTDCDFDTLSYHENGTGYLLDADEMRWFFSCYTRGGSNPGDPSISPLRAPDLRAHELRGLAPALVITAEYDPLRDEGEAYAAALGACGAVVELTRYEGMIHGFFGLGAVFDAGNEAVAESGAALRRAFGTL